MSSVNRCSARQLTGTALSLLLVSPWIPQLDTNPTTFASHGPDRPFCLFGSSRIPPLFLFWGFFVLVLSLSPLSLPPLSLSHSVCVCSHAYAMAHVLEVQRQICVSQFSVSTMWVLGSELGPLVLATNSFTY